MSHTHDADSEFAYFTFDSKEASRLSMPWEMQDTPRRRSQSQEAHLMCCTST